MGNDGYKVGEEHPTVKHSGFDVNLPYIEGVGPSVYGILEAAWLVPAMIAGAYNRIWEYNENVHKMSNVTKIWLEFGWLATDVDGNIELTASGERLLEVIPLVDYEFSMMNQQLDKDYVTDPRKYEQLRTALANYTEQFMAPLLRYVACLPSPGATAILDFGGGDGVYLEAVLRAIPEANGYLYDKAPGTRLAGNHSVEIIVAQFSEITDHFKLGSLDFIIVSEVLHVMGKEVQHHAITTLTALLKTGGKIVIIEQQPNFRLDWRMEAMTEAGACLTVPDIVALADSLSGSLVVTGNQISATHYALVFTKV
jgi:hypothetical protein